MKRLSEERLRGLLEWCPDEDELAAMREEIREQRAFVKEIIERPLSLITEFPDLRALIIGPEAQALIERERARAKEGA